MSTTFSPTRFAIPPTTDDPSIVKAATTPKPIPVHSAASPAPASRSSTNSGKTGITMLCAAIAASSPRRPRRMDPSDHAKRRFAAGDVRGGWSARGGSSR